MTQVKVIKTLDDFDPDLEADETLHIGYRGTLYEIDLTSEHALELDQTLAPWLEASHSSAKWPKRTRLQETKLLTERVKPAEKKQTRNRTHSSLTSTERREARAWARENGWPNVASRGVLSGEIESAWREAKAAG